MQQTATHVEAEQLEVDRRLVDGGRFEIWRWGSGHHALHAGQRFTAGEVLHGFSALARVSVPTRHSLQVTETEHILLEPTFLQYINHGCAPNASLDVLRWEMIALRSIAVGEEILFFYPSTEWLMTCPFRCHCRSDGCLGEIRGAAFLPAHLPPGIPLAPHIHSLLAQRLASAIAETSEAV